MRKRNLFLLFAALLCTQLSFGQKNLTDTLDKFIPDLIKYYRSVGASVAIVKNGKIHYAKGFGTRTIGKNKPVNEHTLFGIGSISKSFTSMALAMLIDEGKLTWDDKVTKYLPYFKLYDPYVTNAFTIRDLLTHRSGLKGTSGGSLWYHSDLNREQIIRGLRHLKPVSGFREKQAYQNTMFIVASEVVSVIAKMSWDDFIRQRIFKPLGMNNSVISEAERNQSKNIAEPHIKDWNFKMIAIKQEKLDNMCPAGGIYSSAHDMAKYINFILNDGSVNGKALIKKRTFREIIKPQVLFHGSPLHNEFASYGLGLWVSPEKGDKMIDHSGGIDGMGAQMSMLKNKKLGVIILTNYRGDFLSLTALTAVMGQFLDSDGFKGFAGRLKKHYPKMEKRALKRKKAINESQIKNTKPSLAIDQYAGVFADKMYGDINVVKKGKDLQIKFSHTPLFTGTLKHWHYDTFEIVWNDPRVTRGFLTFELDSKGKVSGIKLDQPSLLDVDFSELDIKKKR